MNTSNHNQIYKCCVTHVFILFICDNAIKVLKTLKHISRMAEWLSVLAVLKKAVPGEVWNPAEDIYFHFAISPPVC